MVVSVTEIVAPGTAVGGPDTLETTRSAPMATPLETAVLLPS